MLHFSTNFFVWINETGCSARSHIRPFGYSIGGFPPVCLRRLVRVSSLATINADDLLTFQLVHGTVNSDTFYYFIRSKIIPEIEQFHDLLLKIYNCYG